MIQKHHIRYSDHPLGEWCEIVYKGEHRILTWIQWRKRFSKGFIVALEEFIRLNKDKAYELTPHIEEKKEALDLSKTGLME